MWLHVNSLNDSIMWGVTIGEKAGDAEARHGYVTKWAALDTTEETHLVGITFLWH